MLSVIMLSVVMLSVIMLSVIMLCCHYNNRFFLEAMKFVKKSLTHETEKLSIIYVQGPISQNSYARKLQSQNNHFDMSAEAYLSTVVSYDCKMSMSSTTVYCSNLT
jgi:hypothetical protein